MGKGGVLVLGLGNRLLTDDGVGPAILDELRTVDALPRANTRLCDGGTVGLALLPLVEDADALIVLDAARFFGAPGAVRVFLGEEMDAQAGRAANSVHEAGLADLLSAARLAGVLPERRALVGVEPAETGWGLSPTPAVAAAKQRACAEVRALVERWTQ